MHAEFNFKVCFEFKFKFLLFNILPFFASIRCGHSLPPLRLYRLTYRVRIEFPWMSGLLNADQLLTTQLMGTVSKENKYQFPLFQYIKIYY